MSAKRKPAPLRSSEIEPGIRYAVEVLQGAGIETVESCEGGAGHAYSEPTVRFHGGTWVGYRAFAVAMEHGLPVTHLRFAYAAVNGHLEAPCWEIVFDPSVRAIAEMAAAEVLCGSQRRDPRQALST